MAYLQTYDKNDVVHPLLVIVHHAATDDDGNNYNNNAPPPGQDPHSPFTRAEQKQFERRAKQHDELKQVVERGIHEWAAKNAKLSKINTEKDICMTIENSYRSLNDMLDSVIIRFNPEYQRQVFKFIADRCEVYDDICKSITNTLMHGRTEPYTAQLLAELEEHNKSDRAEWKYLKERYKALDLRQ